MCVNCVLFSCGVVCVCVWSVYANDVFSLTPNFHAYRVQTLRVGTRRWPGGEPRGPHSFSIQILYRFFTFTFQPAMYEIEKVTSEEPTLVSRLSPRCEKQETTKQGAPLDC